MAKSTLNLYVQSRHNDGEPHGAVDSQGRAVFKILFSGSKFSDLLHIVGHPAATDLSHLVYNL